MSQNYLKKSQNVQKREAISRYLETFWDFLRPYLLFFCSPIFFKFYLLICRIWTGLICPERNRIPELLSCCSFVVVLALDGCCSFWACCWLSCHLKLRRQSRRRRRLTWLKSEIKNVSKSNFTFFIKKTRQEKVAKYVFFMILDESRNWNITVIW